MRQFSILFFIAIGLVLAIKLSVAIKDSTSVSESKDHKIVGLRQLSLINENDGSISTQIRYLVITDKEAFVCESSLLNGKFNNSDIFWRLEKGKVYDFKVSGIGKGWLTDYRNILEAKEVVNKY